MHDVYNTRLGLAREVTGDWFEELEETVKALKQSSLEEVRLIEAEFTEGDCVIFTDQDMQEVLGVIYFQRRISE
ncbi:hypothetical protein GCM10011383_06680 [Hymenobacter cavernae]|uniref:Uncharacterized protein n=2 Tax=Hymenobacter cavernae TaxID=2044852 RepID=A0ABQ1TLI8_9BACT|nr:hypothetical protein GCM10011383_06680 [Hymenobacter cavernae]